MKINKNTLNKFLKKTTMNGSGDFIREMVLNFTTDGLRVVEMNNANTVSVEGLLPSKMFEDYEALGKVGLGNVDKVISILSGFQESVELVVEGNMLVLKAPGKKVETELLDIEVMGERKDSAPNLDYNEGYMMTMKAMDVNSFIGDASINKEYNLFLETVENKLVMKSSGSFKFTQEYAIDDLKPGLTVKFGSPFIDAYKNLTEDTVLKLNTNYPATIVEDTAEMNIKIIVAPRVDND